VWIGSSCRRPKTFTTTVLVTTFGARRLTLRFRTKSLQCRRLPRRAIPAHAP
jgi:hypothetical protein